MCRDLERKRRNHHKQLATPAYCSLVKILKNALTYSTSLSITPSPHPWNHQRISSWRTAAEISDIFQVGSPKQLDSFTACVSPGRQLDMLTSPLTLAESLGFKYVTSSSSSSTGGRTIIKSIAIDIDQTIRSIWYARCSFIYSIEHQIRQFSWKVGCI